MGYKNVFKIFLSDLCDNVRFNNINNLIHCFKVAPFHDSGKGFKILNFK